MKKGIIMEINDRVLTLLTPEGEFLQARKQDLSYEIGQEIHFIPLHTEERKKSSAWSFLKALKGKSIAVAAFAIVIAFAFSFYSNNEVYAYMSIDINPSIELGVNEKLQVIELIPYNESGKALVGELGDWKKEDINLVLEKIIFEAKEAGYLKARNDVLIGTVHTGKSSSSIEEKLEQTLEKVEEKVEKEEAVLVLVDATNQERELAKENGQTVGNYVKQKQDSLIQNESKAPVTQEKGQNPSKEVKQKDKNENQSTEKKPVPSKQPEKKEQNSKSLSETNANNKNAKEQNKNEIEQQSKDKPEEIVEGNNKQPSGEQNKQKENENVEKKNRTDADSSNEKGQNKAK